MSVTSILETDLAKLLANAHDQLGALSKMTMASKPGERLTNLPPQQEYLLFLIESHMNLISILLSAAKRLAMNPDAP
jgi:hypothetical protein